MAYSGYLLKIGGSTGAEISPGIMKLGTYKAVPKRRLDINSGRNQLGELIRTIAPNKPSEISFSTKMMTDAQWDALLTVWRAYGWDNAERKVILNYYDQNASGYREEYFYVPDIEFTINRIDGSKI